MADEREKKRKKSHASGEPAPAPARDTQDMKAGELLRHIREQKGMELEEVSSAIHVRVAQLRAIEEGHIESLPGMTYALGFVKSYATYLKLDPVMVAGKFKAEHSVTPPKPDLKFPEPMAEHKMPDPLMIGAAVAGVILLLGLWFFFSGGEEKAANTVASNIPPAPAEIAPLTANVTTASTETAGTGTTPIPTTAVPAAASTAATTNTTTATTTPATPATNTTTAVAADASSTPAAPKPVSASKTPSAAPATQTAAAAAEKTEPAASPEAEQPAAATQGQTAQQNPVINIRPGRSRVVLQATQSTWIEVRDSSGNVRLKHVLRPGERYFVPDEPGMSMVTSNAGGLDVYVDGRQTRGLGNPGEIIRGISLNPDALKHGGPATSPDNQYHSHHSLVHD